MNFVSMESFQEEKNQHDLTHWHNKIELIRVMDNSMYCAINGSEYHLQKGDICMINCQQLHRIYCIDGTDCRFHRLMIDPALFSADKVIYQKYILPLLSEEAFAHVLLKRGNRFTASITHLIDEITNLQNLMPVAYELKIIALLYMLVECLYQYLESSRQKSTAPHNTDILLYRRMMDFIHEHYHDKLSLDEIAASGNVSKSKCCGVFKEYAGHSPVHFLNLYRLQVSTDLLRQTDESIADISISCGFGQQSYYNRLFLREYGVTPNAYRKGAMA